MSNNIVEESIIQNNANLKTQLTNVMNQVESTIEEAKIRKKLENTHIEGKDYDIEKEIYCLKQIESYKKKISSLKQELNCNYNYNKLTSKENQIKELKPKLQELKKENDILLKKMQKYLEKGLQEIENNQSTKTDLISISEKIKNLKEECKLWKDLNKSYKITIKKQNAEIIQLQNNCNLIKENIESKKNNNEKEEDEYTDEIKKLKKLIKEREKVFKQDEKNYLNEIKEQDDSIIKENEEINIILIKLKNKAQEAKISEMKLNELIKLDREINGENNYISKDNKVKQTQKVNKSTSLIHIEGNKKYIITNNITTQNERKAPFVIKQFNSNKIKINNVNYSLGKKYSNIKTRNKSSQRSIDFERQKSERNEIKNLKKDLENAFQFTEGNSNLMQDSYQIQKRNIIPLNNIQVDKYNERNMPLNKDNPQSAFKKDQKPIIKNEINENNNNVKKSTSSSFMNWRNKPFDNFYFDNNKLLENYY